uniref:Alternative protein SMARCD1 n=1 Tax=Homo sapiens TaxID=9606 RepID=L8EC99_HUMAN|nr:alternative protein SMARCD1 [Homo sapiens]
MLLVQGQHQNEEGLTRHLLSSSFTLSLPTPSFPLPHKVPMCLYPPLVYIGPLDSVRERTCSGNECLEWIGPQARWSSRGPAN